MNQRVRRGSGSIRPFVVSLSRRQPLKPFQFFQEVRQETAKVTWPTWKEVWITTVMVLIMVTMAAIFFLIVDQILGGIVNYVLRLGR